MRYWLVALMVVWMVSGLWGCSEDKGEEPGGDTPPEETGFIGASAEDVEKRRLEKAVVVASGTMRSALEQKAEAICATKDLEKARALVADLASQGTALENALKDWKANSPETVATDVEPREEPIDQDEEGESSGKKAAGEEGKFGDPDIDPEKKSKIPTSQGKLVKRIDPKPIGLMNTLAGPVVGGTALLCVAQADSLSAAQKCRPDAKVAAVAEKMWNCLVALDPPVDPKERYATTVKTIEEESTAQLKELEDAYAKERKAEEESTKEMECTGDDLKDCLDGCGKTAECVAGCREEAGACVLAAESEAVREEAPPSPASVRAVIRECKQDLRSCSKECKSEVRSCSRECKQEAKETKRECKTELREFKKEQKERLKEMKEAHKEALEKLAEETRERFQQAQRELAYSEHPELRSVDEAVDAYVAEVKRLSQEHKDTLKAAKEELEEMSCSGENVKDCVKDCASDVSSCVVDAEDRSDMRECEREARSCTSDCRKEVKDALRECKRELRDFRKNYRQRVKDLKSTHTTALKTLKEELLTTMEALGQTLPDNPILQQRVAILKTGVSAAKGRDQRKVGLTDMLSTNRLGGMEAISNILSADGTGLSDKMAIAMSGAGSEFVVGHGSGGMGFKGTGTGGGGSGYGRIHGLGKIDTGGGTGVNAGLGRKKMRRTGKVRVGRGQTAGFCKKGDVSKAVRRRTGAIRSCYEKRLQINPQLKGKIMMQWKIGQDGRVKSVSSKGGSLRDPQVVRCVTRMIRGMRFAKPEGGVCVVRWPFVFHSGG